MVPVLADHWEAHDREAARGEDLAEELRGRVGAKAGTSLRGLGHAAAELITCRKLHLGPC